MECSIPVAGNGMTLGLTNGTSNYGIYQGQTSVTANLTLYGTDINTAPTAGSPTTLYGLGVATDSSKSGLVGVLSALSLSSQTLGKYFIRFI